jgi:DNA modification methylase
MESESVQMCVTSPPYFGLRDYGHPGQLGLESTPREYVERMVGVFREVRRVLRDDGTLWLNIGDSYAGGKGQSGQGSSEYQAARADVSLNKPYHQIAGAKLTRALDDRAMLRAANIKPKDLIGIPWMLAFALRNDGWYLRSDIIWHKPNPMPESVKDRPTKAHEYLFLLSTSERYLYAADAIKEPNSPTTLDRLRSGPVRGVGDNPKQIALGNQQSGPAYTTTDGRNKRSVWTIATKPFSGAHFAVFPPALIEPCIRAGSREGDTVLDPFGGSGTTALVALQYNRNAILCELNPTYAEMARKRIADVQPSLLGAA